MVKGCSPKQLHFVKQCIDKHLPTCQGDFTRVLPRVLSLFIFSYLDPRSLCRCSQVRIFVCFLFHSFIWYKCFFFFFKLVIELFLSLYHWPPQNNETEVATVQFEHIRLINVWIKNMDKTWTLEVCSLKIVGLSKVFQCSITIRLSR